MKPVVVDASVAVKWFLPEERSEEARSLLDGKSRLLAPDLLWIEVASVVWKVARRGGLTNAEAEQIVGDCSAFPVEICESQPLLQPAMKIATATDRTVYDSLYVALAEREKCAVVTADQRLVNALADTAWGKRARSL